MERWIYIWFWRCFRQTMASIWADRSRIFPVFQRQKRSQRLQCTMSSEPSCTGRWASSYQHQSEYLSCDHFSSFSHLLPSHFSPSPPVPLFTFLRVFLSILSHLFSSPLSLFFSLLTTFLFIWPFFCRFFSPSNPNHQFYIRFSLS